MNDEKEIEDQLVELIPLLYVLRMQLESTTAAYTEAKKLLVTLTDKYREITGEQFDITAAMKKSMKKNKGVDNEHEETGLH